MPTSAAYVQQSSSRLENIDVLRGIASLAVCWFHLTNSYAQGSVAQLSGQYGWLGVEVFFVLSGFIIPHAMYSSNYELRSGWKIYIAKRLLRLDPPLPGINSPHFRIMASVDDGSNLSRCETD